MCVVWRASLAQLAVRVLTQHCTCGFHSFTADAGSATTPCTTTTTPCTTATATCTTATATCATTPATCTTTTTTCTTAAAYLGLSVAIAIAIAIAGLAGLTVIIAKNIKLGHGGERKLVGTALAHDLIKVHGTELGVEHLAALVDVESE